MDAPKRPMPPADQVESFEAWFGPAPDLAEWDVSLQDEGKRFENLQYVALGVGSVFAIASGVLFYFGYMADDGSAALGSGPLAPRLSLVPTISPGGGGGMLQLRF